MGKIRNVQKVNLHYGHQQERWSTKDHGSVWGRKRLHQRIAIIRTYGWIQSKIRYRLMGQPKTIYQMQQHFTANPTKKHLQGAAHLLKLQRIGPNIFSPFLYNYHCLSNPDPKSKSIRNFHFYSSWANQQLAQYLCYWWKYHIPFCNLHAHQSKSRNHSNKSSLLPCSTQEQYHQRNQQPKTERESKLMERQILSVRNRARQNYLVALIKERMEHRDVPNCGDSQKRSVDLLHLE